MTSASRVVGQPAIVLHTRPYRETSLIISVLTENHGRISLVGRGVRGRRGGSIQPFSVVRIGWSGKSSLGTMTGCEAQHQYWFGGTSLASAFYLAELVTRLVAEREAHPRIYAALAWAFEHLDHRPAVVLRSFEKILLEDLGYGLDFEQDVDGQPLAPGRRYRLVPDRGFEAVSDGIPGELLARIGQGFFHEREVRQAARRLFGEALAFHLGPKPLVSRRLLMRTS